MIVTAAYQFIFYLLEVAWYWSEVCFRPGFLEQL